MMRRPAAPYTVKSLKLALDQHGVHYVQHPPMGGSDGYWSIDLSDGRAWPSLTDREVYIYTLGLDAGRRRYRPARAGEASGGTR